MHTRCMKDSQVTANICEKTMFYDAIFRLFCILVIKNKMFVSTDNAFDLIEILIILEEVIKPSCN